MITLSPTAWAYLAVAAGASLSLLAVYVTVVAAFFPGRSQRARVQRSLSATQRRGRTTVRVELRISSEDGALTERARSAMQSAWEQFAREEDLT